MSAEPDPLFYGFRPNDHARHQMTGSLFKPLMC